MVTHSRRTDARVDTDKENSQPRPYVIREGVHVLGFPTTHDWLPVEAV